MDNNSDAALPPGFTLDQSAPAPAQDAQAAPQQSSDPSELPQGFQLDSDKYNSPSQTFKAAEEGVAKGVLGPVATWTEKHILGVKPEDMAGRAEAHPWVSGGAELGSFVGSMFTGVGEAALVGHAGEAVAKGVGLGLDGAGVASKIAGAGVRAATEMALLSAGDETSKHILDPNLSLASSVANVGLSGLLGLSGGAALGAVSPLWKATFGEKLGQELENFRGRFIERAENPNPVEALTKELTDLHSGITNTADEVYGPNGLKAQEIQKVMPEMGPKISEQAQSLYSKVSDTLGEMTSKPNLYPERLTAKLQGDLGQFNDAIFNAKSPGEIFNATQDLKQTLQGYSKFDKFVKPVDEAYDFVRKAKDLGFTLRNALEDSDVWGKAAERQKSINKAFSEYLPTLQDFQKKFMVEVNGEKTIDPGKINTFVNQLGKPNAEIKQQVLENFINATEKYKSVLGDTHANLGLENPFPHSSMSAIKGALKDLPAGARAADILINKGMANVTGHGLGAAVGAGLGHVVGAPGFGALVGEHALGPFFSSVLPAIAKPVIEHPGFSAGFKAASDYGISVIKGEKLLGNAAKNIFKGAAEIIPPNRMPTEKDRDKLDKALKEAENNPDAMMKVGGDLGHYMPNHASAVASTAMNAVNYLNALRPKTTKMAPLDEPFQQPFQKDRFNSALNVAAQPLVVLQNIRDGVLVPENIQDLKAMYPILHASMAAKLQQEMIEHLSGDGTVPYRMQVGLSAFLGQPLESTISQASIAAAQMAQNRTAANEQAKQAGGMAPKGRSMKNLNKIGEGYQTASQAREAQKQSNKV